MYKLSISLSGKNTDLGKIKKLSRPAGPDSAQIRNRTGSAGRSKADRCTTWGAQLNQRNDKVQVVVYLSEIRQIYVLRGKKSNCEKYTVRRIRINAKSPAKATDALTTTIRVYDGIHIHHPYVRWVVLILICVLNKQR